MTASPPNPPAPPLVTALLDSLDHEVLAALAERLEPYLDGVAASRIIGPREAAEQLGLHERTVARLAREGRLAGAFKIGRYWRFRARELGVIDDVAPPAPTTRAPLRRRRGAQTPTVHAIRNGG